MTPQPQQANPLLITVLLILVVDVIAWAAVPAEAAQVKLLRLWIPNLLPGCAILALLIAIGTWGLLMSGGNFRRRILGFLLLVALLPLLRLAQLYTDLGVLVLNGSRHWIARAATSEDPDRAKAYLAIVLSATQYGMNEAENQVLANCGPREQERLFLLLSEIAPNEIWRRRYLDRWQASARDEE